MGFINQQTHHWGGKKSCMMVGEIPVNWVHGGHGTGNCFQALLWTDSRYFLQAEKQLQGTEWLLMRQCPAEDDV